MSDAQERTTWIVCGRVIGTATGWDQSDTFVMTLYDFEPVGDCKIPKGEILFRFENGTAEQIGEDGEISFSIDLIDAIKDCSIERTD